MPSAAIVGAGVFGAALARRLAGDGWEVTLVESVAPGHPAATSGGESRIVRASHGPDVPYTRSARRARELWRELEAETGERLLLECGVLWFARDGGAWERESERVLAAEGIPFERLDPGAAARHFPSAWVGDLDGALLEPEAGVVLAARATRALAGSARARGATLVTGEARPEGGRVRLQGGHIVEADHVVWACGPWLAGLFPGIVRLRVTRQEISFFAAGPEWAPPATPVWLDYERSMYGVGPLDGYGMKVASDAEGPPFDPETGDRQPTGAAERAGRAYLALRFPTLELGPLASVSVCQYELTEDTRFICAPHPEHPRVWLVGGGSGHGFKHAPVLAERVARMLAGEDAPDPAEGLGPRAIDRGLRTAGLRATPR